MIICFLQITQKVILLPLIDNNKNHANYNQIFVFGLQYYKTLQKILNYYDIDVHIIILHDDEAKDSTLGNVEYIKLDYLMSIMTERTIVIIPDTSYTRHEKNHTLLNMGIDENQIVLLVDIDDMQYFDPEIIMPKIGEVFIDAGAYDGNTTLKFVDWCDGHYKKIFIIEPDINNYRDCVNAIEVHNVSKCVLINKAVWSKDTTLKFSHAGSPGSRITPKVNTDVQSISIDSLLDGDTATFIKLDVEGAELEALKGARNTIKKYRPHIAVSIYHKPTDIFDIPEYLLKLNPDYKFYIRHYSTYYWEMVLHAI